jgi:negative regulator of sigma E activity
MSEKISALIDGELTDREGFEQIDLLKGSEDACRTWETYGLIGDVLRGLDHPGYASRVSSRIATEPVVVAFTHGFATRRTGPGEAAGQKWFLLSAAAVVSAIAFVAWVALPMMANSSADQMARNATGGTVVASRNTEVRAPDGDAASQDVGGYLMAHQQFSPANAMQGVAPYVRLVSEDVDGAGR